MPISPQQFDEMRRRSALGKARMLDNPPVNPVLTPPQLFPESKPRPICLLIYGQIMGGKNNVCITRTGKRYPNAQWADWRDAAVACIRLQKADIGLETITTPVNMRLEYVSEDHRRRDMPAIVDSIFHVLEKAGVVADDTLLWITESTRSYDKQHPRAAIFLTLTNL
jgi:Holliday junction resolvase RusA-like endonuclease